MKITSIVQQQGRKDRYSLHIDGEYRLSLSQNQLTDLALHTGDELSPESLHQLKQQSELGKALDKAYRFLAYRSRSTREITTHLQRKQYDPSMISQVIVCLEEQGLLDDARFARQWIADRQLLNPRSRLELKVELRQKGISSEIIDEVVASITVDDEAVLLAGVIRKKNLRRRYPDERKLKNYLATKGYSMEAIRSALRIEGSDELFSSD